MVDSQTLRKYVTRKKICLIGNAESLFQKERRIDTAFDVICRINRAFPSSGLKYKDFIGERTDIWFNATPRIYTPYAPKDHKYEIWCTDTEIQPKGSILFGHNEWKSFADKLGSRPSTGCISIYFLKEILEVQQLTLFGFDFWSTPSWHGETGVNHNSKNEEQYVKSLSNIVVGV